MIHGAHVIFRGSITRLTLPGGGKLGIYQPKHPSPAKAG
jgi:hypothetical protein